MLNFVKNLGYNMNAYIINAFVMNHHFIFTARAYARAVLGVVILSVHPSVTRVDCDKTK